MSLPHKSAGVSDWDAIGTGSAHVVSDQAYGVQELGVALSRRGMQDLGYQVRVAVEYAQKPADLMVAVHAWRSADSIKSFRQRYPDRPLIVALTGTDNRVF